MGDNATRPHEHLPLVCALASLAGKQFTKETRATETWLPLQSRVCIVRSPGWPGNVWKRNTTTEAPTKNGSPSPTGRKRIVEHGWVIATNSKHFQRPGNDRSLGGNGARTKRNPNNNMAHPLPSRGSEWMSAAGPSQSTENPPRQGLVTAPGLRGPQRIHVGGEGCHDQALTPPPGKKGEGATLDLRRLKL